MNQGFLFTIRFAIREITKSSSFTPATIIYNGYYSHIFKDILTSVSRKKKGI